jgi:hypothetical protein
MKAATNNARERGEVGRGCKGLATGVKSILALNEGRLWLLTFFVASLIPFFQRNAPLAVKLAYAVAVGLFVWICVQFYLPGKGFTYLVMFGGKASEHYIPALKTISHYEEPDSMGYDAQYYAQIAMRPWLSNRALRAAMDSMPYRARRILFSWTAYGLALGDAERALHIYAVQNIVCWFLLAGLLMWWWFPPTNWGNFFRWFGVMFSFGLCFSVRGSLVDGPSLLLIAIGMRLAERGCSWWAAGLLGLAGLGKETNVIAGATFAPANPKDMAGWSRAIMQGLLVIAPLMIWMIVLKLWLGSGGDAGARNFDLPLVAYVNKWIETLAIFKTDDAGSIGIWSVMMLVSLTVQCLFFVIRPRWSEAWWRAGIGYAVLLAVLGDAVWEGYPGAASRVLLPMTLAFNILVPRGRAWWIVLLLGNLTVFFSSETLKPPGRESVRIEGPRALRIVESTGQTLDVIFSENEWYFSERSRFDYWRWSRGSADVVLRNPHPFPVLVDVAFDLKSNDERKVIVRSGGAGGSVLWSGETVHTLRAVLLPMVKLPPGDTVWRFDTDKAAQFPSNGDPRKVSFSLRNMEIRVLAQAPTSTAIPASGKK